MQRPVPGLDALLQQLRRHELRSQELRLLRQLVCERSVLQRRYVRVRLRERPHPLRRNVRESAHRYGALRKLQRFVRAWPEWNGVHRRPLPLPRPSRRVRERLRRHPERPPELRPLWSRLRRRADLRRWSLPPRLSERFRRVRRRVPKPANGSGKLRHVRPRVPARAGLQRRALRHVVRQLDLVQRRLPRPRTRSGALRKLRDGLQRRSGVHERHVFPRLRPRHHELLRHLSRSSGRPRELRNVRPHVRDTSGL